MMFLSTVGRRGLYAGGSQHTRRSLSLLEHPDPAILSQTSTMSPERAARSLLLRMAGDAQGVWRNGRGP